MNLACEKCGAGMLPSDMYCGNCGSQLGIFPAGSQDRESQKAIERVEAELSKARREGDLKREDDALAVLALNYKMSGDSQKAIKFMLEGTKVAALRGDKDKEWRYLRTLGQTYLDAHDVPKAVESFERGLGIAVMRRDRQAEAAFLSSLGMAYDSAGNVQEAIRVMEQCMHVAREIGWKEKQAAGLGALGDEYYKAGNAARAVESWQNGLKLALEVHDSELEGYYRKRLDAIGQVVSKKCDSVLNSKVRALYDTAMACHQRNDLKQARTLFEQGIDQARQAGNKEYLGKFLIGLGVVVHDLNKDGLAADYLKKAETIAAEITEGEAKAELFGNLGAAWRVIEDKKPKKAIQFYGLSLYYARSYFRRSQDLGNLAVLYGQVGDEAKHWRYRALLGAEEVRNQLGGKPRFEHGQMAVIQGEAHPADAFLNDVLAAFQMAIRLNPGDTELQSDQVFVQKVSA